MKLSSLRSKLCPHPQDDLDGYLTFLSSSADGRVNMWTIVKTFLRFSSLFEIITSTQQGSDRVSQDRGTVHDGGTVLSVCPTDKVFMVLIIYKMLINPYS